ncbi:autotransporter domain-containing protein [Simiduia curdlanivorans]|uniref:Autotransporter domain-containing protein n=1 Tax=Simiduia curdlanivorans TaxID=1492769 RepID=A0ABV8V269_9GAMM|nr:autotransporter domain-containing SGNH/GDSL hydrolase family protein [Simiduia curdlanivorans]MDN3637903.1 autotransporter domain-containing protein [Simiduia curdlanivorans]
MSIRISASLKPLAAALLLASACTQAQSPFDQIVAFGDSLTDSGQFPDSASPANPALGSPFSWELRFTNRTDGTGSITDTVAIQRLSQQLGLGYLAASTPILPSPVTGWPDGTNYAVGGYRTDQILASITDTNGSTVDAGIVSRTRDGYLAEFGQAQANTLYYINGGGNDILQGFATNATTAKNSADNLSAGVDALHAAGAKYIMVSNLPDVGNTPAGIGSGAQPLWTPVSALFNDALYANLRASSANVIGVDGRGLLTEILLDPTAFGFIADTTLLAASCYDGSDDCNTAISAGSGENPLYGINQLGNGDPTKLIFNDGVHPTAAAQQIIADYMFSLIQAPQEVGMLPVLGASLVDASQTQLRQQMQSTLASKRASEGQWQIFARGSAVDTGIRNNYLDADAKSNVALLGIQYSVNDALNLGLGFANDSGDLSFDDSASSYDASSQSITLFTGYTTGAHWFNASIGYGEQDYSDLNRVVPLGITARTETGETNGDSLTLAVEYGYSISPHSNWDYGPKIELVHREINVDGYDEASGLTTSLRFDDQKHTSTSADVGFFVHWRAAGDALVVTSEWGIRSQLKGEDYSVTMASQTLDLNAYELPGYSQDKGQSWHGNVTASYFLTANAAITASWASENGDNKADLLGLGVSYSF